jgi:hypothetical protein
MISSMIDPIEQAITDTAANIFFGMIVLGIFAVAMAALMFAGLLLRGAWRWLARRTWGDAIVAAEKRALR